MQLGTIFTLNEYDEAYQYVVENNYMIKEIEPKNGERQFQITEMPQPTEEDIKQQRIEELKGLLAKTDYKIIKCYEASMLNREMPYDLEALVSERDAWRQEINDLENQ